MEKIKNIFTNKKFLAALAVILTVIAAEFGFDISGLLITE
jgi:hypothetical protein